MCLAVQGNQLFGADAQSVIHRYELRCDSRSFIQKGREIPREQSKSKGRRRAKKVSRAAIPKQQ
jgi:hypothetical protein